MSIAPLSLNEMRVLIPRLQVTLELLEGSGPGERRPSKGKSARDSRSVLLQAISSARDGLTTEELVAVTGQPRETVKSVCRALRADKQVRTRGTTRAMRWIRR